MARYQVWLQRTLGWPCKKLRDGKRERVCVNQFQDIARKGGPEESNQSQDDNTPERKSQRKGGLLNKIWRGGQVEIVGCVTRRDESQGRE